MVQLPPPPGLVILHSASQAGSQPGLHLRSASQAPPITAVTHGHHDHVGALVELMEAYPDAPVLLHEQEAPFLFEVSSRGPRGAGGLAELSILGLPNSSQRIDWLLCPGVHYESHQTDNSLVQGKPYMVPGSLDARKYQWLDMDWPVRPKASQENTSIKGGRSRAKWLHACSRTAALPPAILRALAHVPLPCACPA